MKLPHDEIQFKRQLSDACTSKMCRYEVLLGANRSGRHIFLEKTGPIGTGCLLQTSTSWHVELLIMHGKINKVPTQRYEVVVFCRH